MFDAGSLPSSPAEGALPCDGRCVLCKGWGGCNAVIAAMEASQHRGPSVLTRSVREDLGGGGGCLRSASVCADLVCSPLCVVCRAAAALCAAVL